MELIRSSFEKKLGEMDWTNSAALRRQRGLCPEQKSLLFLLSNNLLASNDKLHRFGKAASPLCHSCLQVDSFTHLFSCQSTKKLTDPLKELLLSIQGVPVSASKLVALDLAIPTPLRLPAMFVLAEVLQILLDVRKSHIRLDMTAAIAMIRAKSTVFLELRHFKFAHTIVNLWVASFFDIYPAPSSSQV